MRTGRTPQWPNYFDKRYNDKKIAVLEGHIIYVENIGDYTVQEFADLIDLLFYQNAICFVDSLTNKRSFPFLKESVYSPFCDVLSNKDGVPIAIKCNGKHNITRWIVPASIWDKRIDENFVSDMRTMYKYYKVGMKPTPGSLGRAVLRRSLYLNHEPKHTAPNAIALEYLRMHGYGGRCDTMVEPYKVTQYTYDELLSVDMASGYLAHFMQLMTGTSHWFIGGHVKPYYTYFAECVVTIRKELALGPFPVRTGRKGSKIVYPTLPGTYHTYLWKEQIERAQSMGCSVNISSGIGWLDYTTCTSDFCSYMHNSRVSHTGTHLEPTDKKIGVSTIGGFGMKQTYYYLVSEEEADDSLAASLDDDNNPIDFFPKPFTDYKQPSMLHWRDYCIMLCNLTLFNYALPYAETGRLIMTNYDELIIIATDEKQRYAQKHTLESLMCNMGDLRWQALTNVKIHGDRSLECDQKTVRPGVSKVEETV